jgi:hypothetical protein
MIYFVFSNFHLIFVKETRNKFFELKILAAYGQQNKPRKWDKVIWFG